MESEERYRRLVEFSPEAICVQNEGKVVFINTAGAKLFGAAAPGQIVGKQIIDFVSPEYKDFVEGRFKEVGEKGAPAQFVKAQLIRLDGINVDVEMAVTPFTHQSKPAVQVIFREITERRLVEEKLKQNYELQSALNTILHISLEDISLKDTLERVIEQIVSIPWLSLESKGAILLVEDDPEVLVLTAQRGLPSALQAKCAMVPFGRCMCGRAAQSGRVEFADCVDTRHDNRYDGIIPHGHYCVPIMSAGKVLGVINTYIKDGHLRNPREVEFLVAVANVLVGIIHRRQAEEELQKAKDELEIRVEERTAELTITNEQLREEISERKRIEEALRNSEGEFRRLTQEFHVLLDAITDNIILLSPDLKIRWANKAAASVFGKDVSELTGQHCHKMCCNIFAPCENCPSTMSFLSGKEETAQISTTEGRLFDIRAFPIEDEFGGIKNVIEVSTDITDRVNLQAEALRARHLASLGELAAGVAHEINNPVNSIINYAQILLDDFEKEGRDKDIASRMLKESDRIAGIVRSLLSFARVKKEEKTQVKFYEILSDLFSLTEVQIRKDGINLRVNVPDNLPEIIANPQQVLQVFLNIASNARYALNQKYKGSHEDKILEISCDVVKVGNCPYIRVTFYDQGTGIPQAVRDKIMDPFFSTKTDGTGTGLGLSISHGIISSHGGKLAIDSKDGEFTKVIIDLPVKIKDEA